MANYNTIHVYPDGDVWVVKKGGALRASAIRNTQKEAYEAARDIALNQGLSITVHGPDGKIQRVINPQDRSSNDGCFITTACVTSKRLPDNCHELETLRRFRDSYIRGLPNGNLLIEKYYLIAPKIVDAININPDKKEIYNSIFKKIELACKRIEQKRFKEAYSIYYDTVERLSHHFEVC